MDRAQTLHASNEDSEPSFTSMDPNSPFEHVLPKDGDPWTTLLTPELEADTMRCNSWKDEVQNLLIFAGLFSAVVTAFVIESYKFLQPNPNDTIISLLSTIANGQNQTVTPSSLSSSQGPYSVRINVCWFISLILSLTTVLVGTIALQWLREHQLYVGYSGKEKLAILHMRREAAEAWFLPQVFAMLPLLLQAALVRFLIGLIDFSIPLGRKLTIPVSIIVGLPLLFLAATTLLPSLQGLSFFFHLHPHKTLPIPCPYKSPQSQALQALFGIVLRATIFRLCPPPDLRFDINTLKWEIKHPSAVLVNSIASSIHKLWRRQTWLAYDREWLSLRDACHQRLLDGDPDLYQHRFRWKDSFPLSDISQSLVRIVKQTPGPNSTDSYIGALIHCFRELSKSIWVDMKIEDDFLRKDRRNNYFEQICGDSTSCSMAEFLVHGGDYKFERFSEDSHALHNYLRPRLIQRLLCDEQTLCRLEVLSKRYYSPVIARYRLELWSRALRFFSHALPLAPITIDAYGYYALPTIIAERTIQSMLPYYQSSDQIFSATANVLNSVLTSASFHDMARDQSMHALCTRAQIVKVIDALASLTDKYLKSNLDYSTKQGINNQGYPTLSQRLIHLPLDVVFYLSSIFVWELLDWTTPQKVLANEKSAVGQTLGSLLSSLRKMWSCGQKDERIEGRLKGFRGDRFSDEWWNQLFKHIPGRRAIKPEVPPLTNENTLVSRSEQSLKGHYLTDKGIILPSRADLSISPEVILIDYPVVSEPETMEPKSMLTKDYPLTETTPPTSHNPSPPMASEPSESNVTELDV